MMVVICLMCMLSWLSSLSNWSIQVHAKDHNSFMNKHLKVAAAHWNPFVIFYCNGKEMDPSDECLDESNQTLGGALWELLQLVKQARNVTYSILRPPKQEWGICYSKNNCTGMIGMVYRKEADFALGTRISLV